MSASFAVYDACDEAVSRLSVVIRILHAHNCPDTNTGTLDDLGGWDIEAAADLLAKIRDDLRAAAGGLHPDPKLAALGIRADADVPGLRAFLEKHDRREN